MTVEHSKSQALKSSILFFWCLIGLIVPNIILSFTENLSVAARITNVILPAGIYWLLLSLTKSTGKAVLWMFPFIFLAAFQLVLLNLYGKSVIAVDMFLNLVTTNPSEVNELLSNMLPSMGQVVVIYLIPLIAAIVGAARHWHARDSFISRQRRIATILTLTGIVSFGVSFLWVYNPLRDLFPANAVANAAIAVERYNDSRNYLATSRDYCFDAYSSMHDSIAETYVVVIGETSRAENWQLAGYGRQTNPRLSTETGVRFFPLTLSESNTTHKSVPMLLSAAEATTYNDSINHIKSLITAFREAGFSTAFISAQRRNNSYIDFFGEESDSCVFAYEQVDSEVLDYDDKLLPLLDSFLSGPSKKKLIVMHTYGSHYNYADRYDDRFRKFTPDSPIDAEKARRNELINAYDNSIVKTDWLLSAVIERLKQSGGMSAMAYTSDHGEDIFDDNRNLFLHASPVPSFHQINVPLLVWLSPEYEESKSEIALALDSNSKKNVSSSRSFFHSVLHLGGINADVFSPEASLASPTYSEPRRVYLTDRNEPVYLNDGLLMEEDIRLLHSKGYSVE